MFSPSFDTTTIVSTTSTTKPTTIEKSTTTSEKIYYTRERKLFYYPDLYEYFYDDRITRISTAKAATTSGTVFVGTSGSVEVFYGDDTL